MSDAISHIYKNIYISNYERSLDMADLRQHRIGAILYLGVRQKNDSVLQQYKKRGIAHKFIYMEDTLQENISESLQKSFKFMSHHTDNILVHCMKGISRSPTVVAHYLLRLIHNHIKTSEYHDDLILQEVLELLSNFRPCVNPNASFIKQLHIHEYMMINS